MSAAFGPGGQEQSSRWKATQCLRFQGWTSPWTPSPHPACLFRMLYLVSGYGTLGTRTLPCVRMSLDLSSSVQGLFITLVGRQFRLAVPTLGGQSRANPAMLVTGQSTSCLSAPSTQPPTHRLAAFPTSGAPCKECCPQRPSLPQVSGCGGSSRTEDGKDHLQWQKDSPQPGLGSPHGCSRPHRCTSRMHAPMQASSRTHSCMHTYSCTHTLMITHTDTCSSRTHAHTVIHAHAHIHGSGMSGWGSVPTRPGVSGAGTEVREDPAVGGGPLGTTLGRKCP